VDGKQVRLAARRGAWAGTTRGAAEGYVQCNVTIVPSDVADGFLAWSESNPGVAPVLARGRAGDPKLPELGDDLDIRTDLPSYRVMRAGAAPVEQEDVVAEWADDMVAFAFGCSFSLEEALRRAGVALRYEERGFGGAIYRTRIETKAAGPFAGPLVASMRPLSPADAELAVEVSRRYPHLHGAPIHVGDPADIGVELDDPLDSIGAVDVAAGEVPVFWACGVTVQEALARAGTRIAITHVSSRMLVTDVRLEDLATS
jgi:uncharacterized protein YcsI (UPF0317 family)